MLLRNRLYIPWLVIFFVLAGACSSARKPKTIAQPPVAPAAVPQQPAASPPQPPAEEKQAAQEKPPVEAEKLPETSPPQSEQLSEHEPPSVLLDEALNIYQDALASWEKGDSDAALQSLDEAYALILKAHVPADSPLVQDKNDLRLLIAQRIQQIYASRPVTIGDNHKTIPLDENKDVTDEIVSFQTGERQLFLDAYQRSGFYREMILEELRREGMPEELSWLPMIESWFKVKALSPARALGPWQFISSTGYRFGLRRDRYIDERMDPVKSTRAAVRYLADLHSFFGDWTTALAAYNCGEIRVQYTIRTQRIDYLDNFWDLYRRLPIETARFVPRFIAAVLIINNPEKYGFTLPEPFPPMQFETVTVNQPFKLASLAGSLGIDAAQLAFLNPELRQESTPNYDYPLRVPVGLAEKTTLALNNLPKWVPPEVEYTWHYVKKGETLGAIAARYRTSVAAIARLNALRDVRLLRIGQRLKIPGRGLAASSSIPRSNRTPGDGSSDNN
jgi:membrane-bound lytic murein transglycosylase D